MATTWKCPKCGRNNEKYPYPTKCSRCGYMRKSSGVAEVPIVNPGKKSGIGLVAVETPAWKTLRPNWVLRCVPFSYLAVPPVWNVERYNDNKKIISVRNSVPPIEVYYQKNINKFKIADGIHRANAVKDLGYDCIPSIMSKSDGVVFDSIRK